MGWNLTTLIDVSVLVAHGCMVAPGGKVCSRGFGGTSDAHTSQPTAKPGHAAVPCTMRESGAAHFGDGVSQRISWPMV